MADTQAHTPGPWKTLYLPHVHTYKVLTQRGAPLPAVIASMDKQSVNADEKTQEANARLIAAAPDLLAALESIINNRGRCFIPEDEADALYDWTARAEDAIRKARGE